MSRCVSDHGMTPTQMELDLGAVLLRPASWPWTGPTQAEFAKVPGRTDAGTKRERRTSLDAPESADRREKIATGFGKPQGAAKAGLTAHPRADSAVTRPPERSRRR